MGTIRPIHEFPELAVAGVAANKCLPFLIPLICTDVPKAQH